MATGFKQATVNAASVPATQTNFPSYVDLSRIGITTLAEAQSVRVYADSAKTTEWAREIVSATEMHVKVPSLTSTVSIFVDWDGVRADYAVTDTFGRNAVWSDYTIVLHGDSTTESSGNNTLTHTNVTSVSGKIGQAFDATGATNSYSEFTTKLGTFWDNDYTFQCWADLDSFDATNGNQFIWAGDRNQQHIDISGQLILNTFNAGSSNVQSTSSLSLNTWTMTHWQRVTATTGKLYINGADNTSGTNAMRNPAGTLTQAFRLFIREDNTASAYDGQMDEIRLRAFELTANWITTEYNNQNAESTFWGTWSNVGASLPSNLMMMGVGS